MRRLVVAAMLRVRNVALRSLIVDDDVYFLQAARDLLERQGMVVVGVASTADEALRRAEELRPDVTGSTSRSGSRR
jgi:CheY-like chemotaxis protein